MKKVWMLQRYRRPMRRVLTYALALVLVPFLVGAVGMSVRIITAIRTDTNPPPFSGALPASPAHDLAKRTAVDENNMKTVVDSQDLSAEGVSRSA